MSAQTKLSVPRRRWGRRLALLAACLFALLVATIFVVTSPAFLRAIVLPKIANSLGVNLSVGRLQLRFLSEINLEDLHVTSLRGDPILQTPGLRVRYALLPILRGSPVIHELTLREPVLQVTLHPDGTTSLDPLLAGEPASPHPPPPSPLRLQFRNLSIQGGRVILLRHLANGHSETAELTGLNLTLDQLANGQPGRLRLGGTLTWDRSQPGAPERLVSQGTADLAFTLDNNLLPRTATGTGSQEILEASGALAPLMALRSSTTLELSANELRRLGLVFSRGTTNLGGLNFAGPLDLAKREARLRGEIGPLDRQVLDLLGAPFALQFGATRLDAQLELDLSHGGSTLGVSSRLRAAPLAMRYRGSEHPPIDLSVGLNGSADFSARNARIALLSLDARLKGRPLATAELSRPVSLSWGNGLRFGSETALTATLTNLLLADWQTFTGNLSPRGTLEASLSLVVPPDLGTCTLSLSVQGRDLDARLAGQRSPRLQAEASLKAAVRDFKVLAFGPAQLEIRAVDSPLPVFSLSGSGQADFTSRTFEAEISSRASLPAARVWFPTNMVITRGTLQTSARTRLQWSSEDPTAAAAWQNLTLKGSARLEDFAGTIAGGRLEEARATAEFDLAVRTNLISLEALKLDLEQQAQPAGRLEASARYDRGTTNFSFALTLPQLNERLLRPWITTALGSNRLESAQLQGSAQAAYAPSQGGRLKTELRLDSLRIKTPARPAPITGLAGTLAVDLSYSNQIALLRQGRLNLSPTPRAANQVNLSGSANLAHSNAITGLLLVTSEALDLTPFADLLIPSTNAASSPPAPPPVPAKTGNGVEPGPYPLPFHQFTGQLRIDRIHFQDLTVSNANAVVLLDTNRIRLHPVELMVHGTPVRAEATLGTDVPGFTYEASLLTRQLPLQPFVDAFAPQYRGRMRGDMYVDARFKGKGTTGPRLQTNLNAQVSLTLTNAHLDLLTPRAKSLVTPIATVLQAGDVARSPLDWLTVSFTVRNGRVELGRTEAQSSAFHAALKGGFPLSDPPSRSPLNLPIDFALRHSLARSLALLPAGDSATNPAAYAPLPAFATVRGTLGEPRSEVNRLALGSLMVRSGIGIADNLGVLGSSPLGQTLRSLGAVLGSQLPPGSATNNPASPAPPTTNSPATLNLFDLLRPGRP